MKKQVELTPKESTKKRDKPFDSVQHKFFAEVLRKEHLIESILNLNKEIRQKAGHTDPLCSA